MNNFSKSCAILRTFDWATCEHILGENSGIDQKTLLSAFKGEYSTINLVALNKVSTKYNVSKDFLLDGALPATDISGLIDEKEGGIVAYFPDAVTWGLVNWLVKNKPQLDDGVSKVDYDWGDAQWDACSQSLYREILGFGQKPPEHKLYISGHCIGLCVGDGEFKDRIEGLLNEAFQDLAKSSHITHKRTLVKLGLIKDLN